MLLSVINNTYKHISGSRHSSIRQGLFYKKRRYINRVHNELKTFSFGATSIVALGLAMPPVMCRDSRLDSRLSHVWGKRYT